MASHEPWREHAVSGSGRTSAAGEEEHVIEVPPITPQPAPTSQNALRDISLPLYRAAMKGDWEAAKRIFDEHPDAVRARITATNQTVLHVAVASGHAGFVKNLVARMTNEDLSLESREGETALMTAARSGSVEVARILLERDRSLTSQADSRRSRTEGETTEQRQSLETVDVGAVQEEEIMLRTPINLATVYGRHEMVRFLYKSMDVFDDSQLQTHDRISLFVYVIYMGIYDVALDMLRGHAELATAANFRGWTALHALVHKPKGSSYLRSSNQLGIWDKLLTKCSNYMTGKKDLSEQLEVELLELVWEQILRWSEVVQIQRLFLEHNPLHIIAATNGNVDFLTIATNYFPDLVLSSDGLGRNLFHIAVYHRQHDIFKMIYKFVSFKDKLAYQRDVIGNTMLHYAAFLPPLHRLKIVSGAALQLQRELLWFKEVRNIVPPFYEEHRNVKGKTAQEVFRDAHKTLMEEGQKWMKDTANSCMLVAALIATVVFAVAFTVPGGNTDEGTPVYLKKLSFKVFSILDSISLICSSTSILTFLSILTARYTEEDFLWSLPSKLIVGLSTLYASIIAMMAAFGAAFFIIFEEGIVGVAIGVGAATCIPILWYALMLRHVFVDVFRSTFMPDSLFRSINTS